VVLGAVGAAAASWLDWQTTGLPSNTEALRINEVVAGEPIAAPAVERHDGRRDFRREVSVSPSSEQVLPNWTIEAAQARLQADGWTLGRVQKSTTSPSARGDERSDGVFQVFQATRDGHTVTGYAHTDFKPEIAGTHLDVTVSPAAPGREPVAILLGWLVGVVTAWLITGWAGYRLRRQAPLRRLAALLLGLTALGLAAHPTIGLYHTLTSHAFTDLGVYGAAPAYYWVVARPAAELVAGTLTAGLAILILAATARRPTGRPTAAMA
jgi:hypothetical protein